MSVKLQSNIRIISRVALFSMMLLATPLFAWSKKNRVFVSPAVGGTTLQRFYFDLSLPDAVKETGYILVKKRKDSDFFINVVLKGNDASQRKTVIVELYDNLTGNLIATNAMWYQHPDEMDEWNLLLITDLLESIPIGKYTPYAFAVKLPIRAGYWAFTDSTLASLMQPYVTANLGIEIYPESRGQRNEFSIGLAGEYRYGKGAPPIFDIHMISAIMPLKYHFGLTPMNWLTLGAGPFFEWQIWQLREPYKDAVLSTQTVYGVWGSIGYSLHLNERISIDTNAQVHYYILENIEPVVQFYLGTTITLYRK